MGTYQRKMAKPPAHVSARLSGQTMTDRQAKRVAAGGSLEGKRSDYTQMGDDDDRRRRDARRAIEDMRIMRELGL